MSDITKILACPICHNSIKINNNEGNCEICRIKFNKKNSIFSFICEEMYRSDEEFDNSKKIIDFWGKGWEKRMQENNHAFIYKLDIEGLKNYIESDIKSQKMNHSMINIELDLNKIKNKNIVNIGCGSGTESLIFSYFGANCIGIDITSQAANKADYLINKVNGYGLGLQADARFLPIKSSSIDIVYSNGVLHHSPDIQQSLNEIYRILKPKGKAYIMLYATWSLQFLQERIIGFLKGKISRNKQREHMSSSTEGAWVTGMKKNPYTETFSIKQCRKLLNKFQKVNIRKDGFSLSRLAKIGKIFSSKKVEHIINKYFKFLRPLLGSCIFIEAEK